MPLKLARRKFYSELRKYFGNFRLQKRQKRNGVFPKGCRHSKGQTDGKFKTVWVLEIFP